MIKKVQSIAQHAGKIILEHYDNMSKIVVNVKKDSSPVTQADIESEKVIVSMLKNNFSYPILTEETPSSYNKIKDWKKYWLVDPLDGTQDFLERNDEFTINIALIQNNKPILGVVFAPALDLIYTGEYKKGAYKNGKKIYNSSKRKKLIGADSRHNSSKETLSFLKKHNVNKVIRAGSALKLCYLAEGKIDVYPRFNGTKEWDTAASHIVCNESGCKIIDIETNKELTYHKRSIKNNFFIASRNNLFFL